jgi:predicted RNase H-like nuclease (RuvC/YqgF family)
MRIECSKCGEIVETTATTVVSPFVCDQCNDQVQCPPDRGCDAAANDMVDGDSIPSAWTLETEAHTRYGNCVREDCTKGADTELPTYDTETVENTTLLIEDLEQQLQDERATVVALEAELATAEEAIKGMVKKQEAEFWKQRSEYGQKERIMGTIEKSLRSYPKQVRGLARKYDTLFRKIDAGTFTPQDYIRLGKIGDEIAFRAMWGDR